VSGRSERTSGRGSERVGGPGSGRRTGCNARTGGHGSGRRALAGLAVVIGLVAGCSSIPDSSAPRVVGHFDPSRDPAAQGVLQDTRPGVGATESQIVDGFIRAQPAWQDGHEPARRFLTTRAAERWHDDAETIVAASAPKVGAIAADHVIPVTFTPVGRVSRDGSYLPEFGRAAAPVTWRLQLRKQDGEWRIDRLPDTGVVLSRTQFEQSYRPYTLYFLDRVRGRLVPDRRYLPNDPGSLVQQLVRRLLDGPSDWLQPVVSNDLAPPVTLTGIRLEHQVVHVDLGGLNVQVLQTRLGAVAQLVWTLTQLTNVFGVQVTSDGQRVELRDLDSAVLGATDLPQFDPDALPDSGTGPRPAGAAGVQAYYVRAGAVYTLDGGRVLDGRYRLSAVAVSTDLQLLAGVGPAPADQGVTVLVGRLKGPLRGSPVRAGSLTRPSWNRSTGTFWTVADGLRILSVSPDGRVRPVGFNASWLGVRVGPIGALRLSRDGTRVAFAAGPAGHRRLYVGRATRTTRMVTIEDPVPITPALVDVRDVAWESATMLVVLGATAGRPVSPWRVLADGSSIDPSPMPPGFRMDAITAAPDDPVVSSAGGVLSVIQGTWVSPGRVRVSGTAPAYPG